MGAARTTAPILKWLQEHPNDWQWGSEIEKGTGLSHTQVLSGLLKIRKKPEAQGHYRDLLGQSQCVMWASDPAAPDLPAPHHPNPIIQQLEAHEEAKQKAPEKAPEEKVVTLVLPANVPEPPFPVGLVLEIKLAAGDRLVAEGDNGKHYRLTMEPL